LGALAAISRHEECHAGKRSISFERSGVPHGGLEQILAILQGKQNRDALDKSINQSSPPEIIKKTAGRTDIRSL
jgi:hypothetical protein